MTRLAHLGHACVLVETARTRILVDPGTLSGGFESLRELDAVFVTHQHADHVDLARLPALMAANPRAVLVVDPGSAAASVAVGLAVQVLEVGSRVVVQDVAVDAVGGRHELVHADVPLVGNNALVFDGGAFYHPGDSYFVPDQSVDVLGAPCSGPWVKVGEAVDFVRAVAPRVAVPIHEAALADTSLHYGMLHRLCPPVTSFRPLPRRQIVEV